ncbi:MAG: hypothetical protein MR384_13265 [Lachnospiraceae bacterium]|jgi:hypothetical protein|nr:hypothetical protein [Lachnospiraceae bacterium]DAV24476.1 MAG TPA: hypothetical protein [Caudoviricetes sp.]
MEEQILEEILKKNIKSIVSEKIDEEIEQKVNNFKKELEDRKDNYIAEIMKGIRVYHERDIRGMGINYKIIFENIYRIEKE